MKILVTGAAGFIGSHLCEALIFAGNRVGGVDNFDPFYPREIKEANLALLKVSPQFEFFEMDLLDRPELNKLFQRGWDAVVHLAAKAGVRPSILDPLGYVTANVTATALVLEEAKIAGIKTVLLASSSSVYGNNSKVPFSETDSVDRPISPYAATKKSCELLAETYAHLNGLKIACLRFFTVYGPRQRPDLAIAKFSQMIKNDQALPFYGDGSTERDYTYIGDIVQGLLRCLDWLHVQPEGTCEVFNLGENRTTTLSRLVELLEQTLGKKALIEKKPLQPGDVQRTFADISKAKRVFRYDPQTQIEEGLKAYADWLNA